VVALVAAGTWAEGRRRAPAERSALSACAVGADRAAVHAERQVATTASYVAPALASADASLRDSMLGLVSRSAELVVDRVEEALATCRSVEVWPFNRSHDETRDAYVAYLVAERDRLRLIARDGAAFHRGYAEVRRLAAAAEEASSRLSE
jgi:hypothetical protein